MRKALMLVSCLILGLSMQALAGGLERLDAETGFRDAHFGMTPREMGRLKLHHREGVMEIYTRTNDTLEFAGTRLSEIRYGFRDGRLNVIWLFTDNFDSSSSLYRALSQAYGKARKNPLQSDLRSWNGKKNFITFAVKSDDGAAEVRWIGQIPLARDGIEGRKKRSIKVSGRGDPETLDSVFDSENGLTIDEQADTPPETAPEEIPPSVDKAPKPKVTPDEDSPAGDEVADPDVPREAADEATDEATDEAADEATDEAADEAADEAVDEAADEATEGDEIDLSTDDDFKGTKPAEILDAGDVPEVGDTGDSRN